MKVWCVFFVDEDGCLELKGIFHSQDRAGKFAVEFAEEGTSVEYFIESRWVK